MPKPHLLAGRGGCWFETGSLKIHVVDAPPLAGYDRIFTSDPFGNRIELMQPI